MCPLKKYPMEMPMLFIPQNWIQGTSHHYSDGLTEDAWAHFLLPVKWFSPDIFGSVSFFNANCENHAARCHKLVLGQWLVHAFVALGLSRCHWGPGAEMLPPPHSWGELSPQLGATKLVETPPWGRGHPARPVGSSVEGLIPVVSWGCCPSQMP